MFHQHIDMFSQHIDMVVSLEFSKKTLCFVFLNQHIDMYTQHIDMFTQHIDMFTQHTNMLCLWCFQKPFLKYIDILMCHIDMFIEHIDMFMTNIDMSVSHTNISISRGLQRHISISLCLWSFWITPCNPTYRYVFPTYRYVFFSGLLDYF